MLGGEQFLYLFNGFAVADGVIQVQREHSHDPDWNHKMHLLGMTTSTTRVTRDDGVLQNQWP